MPDKAKKAPKNAQNKPKKAVKIPNPPEYFCGYSLKKLWVFFKKMERTCSYFC